MRTCYRDKLRKMIVSAAAVAVLISCILPHVRVNADRLINLSVRANNTDPGVGDIVTVSVIADNFPDIVRFGPMKIHYDEDLAEYVSVELGGNIVSFVYNTSLDTNFINISAVDQYFQETGDEDGSNTAPAEVTYSSDSQTILLSVSFRVKQDASGQIPFWIEDTGSFVSATGEEVTTVVDNSISVTISDKVSDDCDLVMLKLNNVEIEPAFSPDVTTYSATVDRSITDIAVNATPSNLWAGVIINGNSNLQFGRNKITISVTALDGVTTKEYTVNVNRREGYVPEGAGFEDMNGIYYTLLDAPASFVIPEGYSFKMRTVGVYTVPAYVKEGVSSVLLYLYDGENPPGLYMYNSDLKTVVPYVPDNFFVRKSMVLLKTEIPEGLKIPSDFTPASMEINGTIYEGFYNWENDFICYLSDEAGNCDFYEYDGVENIFFRYVPVDKTAEKTYSALLVVFMIIIVIETAFIVTIVIIVNRVLSNRNNPRPRRV